MSHQSQASEGYSRKITCRSDQCLIALQFLRGQVARSQISLRIEQPMASAMVWLFGSRDRRIANSARKLACLINRNSQFITELAVSVYKTTAENCARALAQGHSCALAQFPVAVLVLLATAARARLVSANLAVRCDLLLNPTTIMFGLRRGCAHAGCRLG